MDYDKEEMDRKLRQAGDIKFFYSKEGWSEGAISKEDRKSFTYNAVKNTTKEIMNESYFDLHPLKSISKQEAEAIFPRKNTFTLTDKQLDKLQDVLSDHTDCGPMHEGWSSNELIELIEVFSDE